MKKFILSILILFVVNNLFAQNLSKEETIDYINKKFKDYYFNYFVGNGFDLSDAVWGKILRIDVSNHDIIFYTYYVRYNQEIHINSYETEIRFKDRKIEFLCKDQACIVKNSGYSWSFYISSGKDIESLFNAFKHLLTFIETVGVSENIDPFKKPDSSYKPSFLVMKPIKYSEQTINQRIDENENILISFEIENQGKGSARNVIIKIDEFYNVPGLIFKETYTIESIEPNQKITVNIPVSATDKIEINQAEFKIEILEGRNKIDELSLSIPTYKSIHNSLVVSKISDVDINIPVSNTENTNLFALIIGNENYSSSQTSLLPESNVPYAENDAVIITNYLKKTLGVPSENTTTLINATKAQTEQAINKIQKITQLNPNAEIIIYYAGHGLPDPETKDQILIPVDVTPGNFTKYGIKVNDLLQEITAFPSKRITIFIDACFSGGARNQSLLASRSVKVKPKNPVLQGNIVMFSSSSDLEESGAYPQEKHGLFTYFLLKKIQESKGSVSYKDLFSYLSSNVAIKSVLVNNKIQTPSVSFSIDAANEWESWLLK